VKGARCHRQTTVVTSAISAGDRGAIESAPRAIKITRTAVVIGDRA